MHNGKVIYPVIWSAKNPGKTTLISPVPYLHYVKNHAHVAFNKNFGPLINRATYALANYGLLKTIMSLVKSLNLSENFTQKDIQTALFKNRAIYTVSPTLFPKPPYWEDNLHVLGYYERNKTSNWEAPESLNDFLNSHEKICFLTFGSMINREPERNTQTFLKVLEKNNIPTIINTASGGLIKPDHYNEQLFYFTDRIPYDWVFPKIHAVIHHGGSGTTHTALKYGCASLIIPHIIDQFIWNKILNRKGAGPLGMDISKVTEKKIEPLIIDLYNNESYKTAAENLGEQIKAEDFENEIIEAITYT